MVSTEIEKFFNNFDDVYENRHQYNIEWAFKDAQKQLDEFKVITIDNQLKKKCTLCNNQKQINSEYKEFRKNSHSTLKRQRWYFSLFSNSYTFLTALEIVLSIILVLIISEVSHSRELAIESEVFSLWVVTTFAFFKVFLEKYFMKPRIEELGWKLYLKKVKSLKSMTEEFNNKISLDINQTLKEVA